MENVQVELPDGDIITAGTIASRTDIVKAPAEFSLKAVNDETKEILHLITTGSRDRAGDIVSPTGARLKNYRKNPVVLVNHDYRVESIIGRSVHIEAGDDGLYSRTRFLDTPLARDAFALAKEKLGGWSIGFSVGSSVAAS